jgi:solute carrier family 35
VAAATDLSFNVYAYLAVFSNDFLTALYLVMVKNTPVTSGLTTTGLLFYNATLSLPLLGVAVLMSREPQGIVAYSLTWSRSFQVRPAMMSIS